ncbi:MAG: VWA domain-containing protein [Verrucomicrobia bacterium]|nr:VWA domain-containing protein [Verrucomicrobiota bacterium]
MNRSNWRHRSWKGFWFFILSVSLATGSWLQAQERQECLIVLDASNSMSGYKKGTQKMRIAKGVIGELVATMPENIDLGLVVYGHRRKSDCDDIELMISPAPLNRSAFMQTVNSIRPNGKTPLTNAIEFAANSLSTAREGASIILLTDGLETCKRDPCEAVAALLASGIKLTAHVIAFDLSADQASQIECIAELTGGRFLATDNAEGLLDALTVAINVVATGPSQITTIQPVPQPAPAPTAVVVAEPEPEPVIEEFPITLTVPESVPAGSDFEVAWQGPGNPDDFITIVPDWAEERVYKNRSQIEQNNPVTLKALIDPQKAEVRYISAATKKVLGRATVNLTEVEASVSGPSEAVQGNTITVEWTGPAYSGDFLTIVAKDAEPGTWKAIAYAKRGTPEVKITGLPEAGLGEIRYITGQDRRTLARADINFVEAFVTLSAVEEAIAGGDVTVEWAGPANKGDYITIVPAATEEGKYLKYAYAKLGEPIVKVTAPMDSGPAEIRYIAGSGRATLARIPILIKEAEVTLSAPADAVAGSAVNIDWDGPGNKGDFITIVPTYAEERTYMKYAYAQPGEYAVKVVAPMDAGDAEIRYLSGSNRQVLARRPITIHLPEVTLTAPEETVAGSTVKIEWTGPANQGDFITIVSKYADERTYSKVGYAKRGSEVLDIVAPMDVGEAEVRYLAGSDRRTLARVPIQIKAAEIVLNAVRDATVGNLIRVEWQGPANKGDFITLVNKSAADSFHQRPAYVTRGKPVVELQAPMTPGEMEIRYIGGANRVPLGRIPLTLAETRVGLEPPESAVINQTIYIHWSGPQNQNDYLTIVPAGSPDNQRGPVTYTNQGSPASIRLPGESGKYEVRYIAGQGREVLGRTPIEILDSEQ